LIVAIMYRAIWRDIRTGLVECVRESALQWIEAKYGEQFEELRSQGRTADDAMRLVIETEQSAEADADVEKALKISFVEEDKGTSGRRWTTTIRCWEGPPVAGDDPAVSGGWIWVDLDAVSDASLDDVIVAAPGLVRNLLASEETAWRRQVRLSSKPLLFKGEEGSEELAGLVTDIERDLPIVVFAPLPDTFTFEGLPLPVADQHLLAIERAAAMAAGLTAVCVLDKESMDSFNRILGLDYGIWDGAFRIYLPGADPALDEAWKHRYTVPARFLRYRDTAGKIISRSISLRAGARRPPASYELARRLLASARSRSIEELTELLGMADDELAEARDKTAMLDQRYQDGVEELQQLEADNNRLRSELNRARKKLAYVEGDLWREHPAAMGVIEKSPLPPGADSPSEAASLAQKHLREHVCLPDDACVDLADIDSTTEARAWGQTSWRAFMALYAYGQALTDGEGPGSFWTWCVNSGHADVWPATTKKLAMAESETVRHTERLYRKRLFSIDTAIDPTGKVHMEMHIKISEGGGPLAPRIYFLPVRASGKVHIGYFGPHKNLPNSLT
jgi:hypothetical protein